MKPIFDFTKTYTGAITNNQQNYPCSLDFLDDRIVFTVVTADFVSLRQVGEKFELYGIITTEKGLHYFRAINALLISHSYSRQQFQAEGVLVSREANDLSKRKFRQGVIVFDRLDQTGIFLNVQMDPNDINQFYIEQKFKELSLLESDGRLVQLNNPNQLSFGGDRNLKLSISINPHLTFQSNIGFDEQELRRQGIWASWFFQLVFRLKQRIVSVTLFDQAVADPSRPNPSPPCYYLHSEIVRNVRTASYIPARPHYLLEEILADLPLSYAIWEEFNEKQRLICRLYFNELNTRYVIQDDRFKNFCAIIQGLEVFLGSKPNKKIKGKMNRELRNTLDSNLENLLFPELGKDFIFKLFDRIGDQRDLFQHLNKPIKFDFNNNKSDIVTINQLMSLLISYHLRKTIELPKDKLLGLAEQELIQFKHRLLDLKQRLK